MTRNSAEQKDEDSQAAVEENMPEGSAVPPEAETVIAHAQPGKSPEDNDLVAQEDTVETDHSLSLSQEKTLPPTARAAMPTHDNPQPQADSPFPPPMASRSLPHITKTLEIKITLPVIRQPEIATRIRAYMLKKWNRQRALVGGVAITLVTLLGLYHVFLKSPTLSPKISTTKVMQSRPPLLHGMPSYPTVLPAGKSIQNLGGWTRISPSGRNPVYTYVDKIDNVPISVSEQPLPASFQANPASAVAQLAQGFNADQKITINNVTVYIATAADGAQSLILSKANLLILIKSASLVGNNQWATYTNSLQ